MNTRFHPTTTTRQQPHRVSESMPFTADHDTTRLFESFVREIRETGTGWTNFGGGDMCGNSLFGGIGGSGSNSTTENRWNSLFPPLSASSATSSSSSPSGTGLATGSTSSTAPINLIDIVFEYDDTFQQFNTPEGEASIQRMIQNDDFRNQILRAAGLGGQGNVMRWIVAPEGLEDTEPRGLSMEEIRGCTESLVYSEGMEGLLSTVCPITMEEYVAGDRLLQLRECRHAFRERELVEWFQRHDTCPGCRNRVVE